MSDVELTGLTKRFGETLAVDDVSLRVEEGEFFSLLGPSGCGKTTTLRMIAGFVRPNEGQVFIGGEDMTLLPPEKRGIGIVFQNYAIFPHMTVFDNIAFGLKMRKVPKREIRGRVGKALEQVNLDGYERRYQRELSGGEQQRVALARVLITEPKILLLDEPLSALDKKLREEMKYWIKGLQQSLAITTVYVTHDQGEALTMSDRIAVMNRAKVVQIGAPDTIYEHPADRFVTDFIGESNILEARVAAVDGNECRIAVGRVEFAVPRRDGIEAGQSVGFVVRPERVLIGSACPGRRWPQSSPRPWSIAAIRARSSATALQLEGQEIVAEVPNRPDQPELADGAETVIGWTVASGELLDRLISASRLLRPAPRSACRRRRSRSTWGRRRRAPRACASPAARSRPPRAPAGRT